MDFISEIKRLAASKLMLAISIAMTVFGAATFASSGISFAGAIAVLDVIGMWMIYYAAKNDDDAKLPTATNLLRVAAIIRLVGAILATAICLAVLIVIAFIPAVAIPAALYGGEPVVAGIMTAVVAVMGIVIAASFGLTIWFDCEKLAFAKSLNASAKAGANLVRRAKFNAALYFIDAGFSLIAVPCMIAGMIVAAQWLPVVLERLVMAGEITQAEYSLVKMMYSTVFSFASLSSVFATLVNVSYSAAIGVMILKVSSVAKRFPAPAATPEQPQAQTAQYVSEQPESIEQPSSVETSYEPAPTQGDAAGKYPEPPK